MSSPCQMHTPRSIYQSPLRVGGLEPMTTIDYPDHLACVLFCQGCAWNCRYCHNPELIRRGGPTDWNWSKVLNFLRERQGLLEAVVFSGGEATLQPALPNAMRRVRELGYKVGLHSAGIKPASFGRALLLSDWVGFDVKALEEDTALITGVSNSGQANWRSLEMLLDSGVDYECRTTVHWDLTDPARLQRLGERLASAGVKNFAVQIARTAQMLDPCLDAHHTPEEAQQLWPYLNQLFERFELREA